MSTRLPKSTVMYWSQVYVDAQWQAVERNPVVLTSARFLIIQFVNSLRASIVRSEGSGNWRAMFGRRGSVDVNVVTFNARWVSDHHFQRERELI